MTEFVNANQTAGYASFDLKRGNTRKYHALMMAGSKEFARVKILASQLETVTLKEHTYDITNSILAGQQYAPAVRYLKSIYYLPFPRQVLQIGPLKITRNYEFSDIENVLEITYVIDCPEPVKLEICPLLNFQPIHGIGLHSIFTSNTPLQLIASEQSFTLGLPEGWEFTMQTTGMVNLSPSISTGHFYPEEKARGYEDTEDLFSACKITFNHLPGKQTYKIKYLAKHTKDNASPWQIVKGVFKPANNSSILTDITHLQAVLPNCAPDFSEFLAWNARQFLIREDTRYSIIAGYHWFGEWSRDTFISFNGLLLATGKIHEAQRVLLDWSKYLNIGLLPNQMDGLHYNSLDGVLWYVLSVWQYWEQTKDKETILHLLPKLERIVYAFTRGSKYEIKLTNKGYLVWEDKAKALTWMDAIVNDTPVTERSGAAVEIQALWYNALQTIEALSAATGHNMLHKYLYDQLEDSLEQNLLKDFWLEDKGYFADVVEGDSVKSAQLRPNQLALFAMPFRIPGLDKYISAIAVCEQELVTALGLKTLSNIDPDYKPIYMGTQSQRDLCYHQGVVWPWLLVWYYNALFNMSLDKSVAKEKIKNHLDTVWEELKARSLIHVPEIFSDYDLKAAGTVAQAWSVAALIEGWKLVHHE